MYRNQERRDKIQKKKRRRKKFRKKDEKGRERSELKPGFD